MGSNLPQNPATILSRLAEFWEQCLFWPDGGEWWILWDLGTTSCFSSGSDVLPATKSAGVVGNSGGKRAPFFVESSGLSVSAGIVEETMLDQQLTKAVQTGLRHSLDDPDHDAMSDL